jgi:hypothetical protein
VKLPKTAPVKPRTKRELIMRLQWDCAEAASFGEDEQKKIRAMVTKSIFRPGNPFRWCICGLPDSLDDLEDEWGYCSTLEQAIAAAEAALSAFHEEQAMGER